MKVKEMKEKKVNLFVFSSCGKEKEVKEKFILNHVLKLDWKKMKVNNIVFLGFFSLLVVNIADPKKPISFYLTT